MTIKGAQTYKVRKVKITHSISQTVPQKPRDFCKEKTKKNQKTSMEFNVQFSWGNLINTEKKDIF